MVSWLGILITPSFTAALEPFFDKGFFFVSAVAILVGVIFRIVFGIPRDANGVRRVLEANMRTVNTTPE